MAKIQALVLPWVLCKSMAILEKKTTTKQNQKEKNDFSMHFTFTGYGKNGDPNIRQAYRR